VFTFPTYILTAWRTYRKGISATAVTDASGVALLSSIPSGRWLVVVSGLGYGSARSFIDFDGTTEVEGEVALAEGPIALDEIVVSAERGLARLRDMGFYQRRTVGIGEFIDREMIDEKNPQRPSDLFRTMAGVALVQMEPGRYAIASRRGFTGFGLSGVGGDLGGAVSRRQGACLMDLYVDGVRYERRQIDDFNSDWIEAIEVYNGLSEIPPQYNRTGSFCGVVLVWTRR
jgi:hypothetical protein